ncbi:MAG: hypothetical protein IH605_06135 [Burkholderiales bacterium]|nr:hypothetical protein [Burkholderiales bacterium]
MNTRARLVKVELFSNAKLMARGDTRFVPKIDRALAEGVVADADLADAGLIFGTGFAPFRGGPLNYLKSR